MTAAHALALVLLTVVAVPTASARDTLETPPAAASVAADAGLPRRATEHLERGQPVDAWSLLLDELLGSLQTVGQPGGLTGPAAEIGCLMLAELTYDLDRWTEAAQSLAAARPWPDSLPPAVAARLEATLAESWRRTGHVAEALALRAEMGYVSDLLVIGPFDNDRGSGFNVAYEPESRFDREAPVRGKERDVSWHPLPISPRGWVDVAAVMRPNEQAVAYLATALSADAPRQVVLSLGSSCAFKVFLNGRQIAARNIERPARGDQDRVVLPLQAGWNSLLVKLGVETGAWYAGLRLTDLAGRPAADVPVDSGRLALAQATLPATDEQAVALPPSSRELLEAATEDAESLRLLARFHLVAHPDGRADLSARRAAEQAVALDPGDVQGQYLLARASAADGASREEIAVTQRLDALNEVLRLDPEHVPALLDLAAFSSSENPLPDRVDELTRRALEIAPDYHRALSRRARHLEQRDRDTEAELLEHAVADAPGRLHDDRTLARVARRLLRRGDRQAAEQRLTDAFQRSPVAGRVLDALLGLHIDAGQLDEARTLVERAWSADPIDPELLLRAAKSFEYAGDEATARDLLGRALALCAEDTRVHEQLVRLDVRAGRLDAAVAHLDQIVRLAPGDDDARRHRALLSPDERDAFEDPYRWDALELASAPLPESGGNDRIEMLRRTTVFKANPDGTEHRYEHVAMRALNLGGVKALDTYSISAAFGSNLHVYTVRVIHPDGSFERAPAPRRGRGSFRYYDLPPLSVGDIVDVEYRIDETEPDVFGEYFGTRHSFYPERIDGEAPTRLSELVVIAPEDVPVYAFERNADNILREATSDDQGNAILRWTVRDLPRPAMQGNRPGLVEFGPIVDVTTFRDWDAFAHWWWSFIEKEFDNSPAMSAKVDELTAGLTSEREKVEAINRFVSQEIRYNSWPFGTHGYEPFKASTIFERRFGDCKDKSILLRQMLAEIDVEAIPVLIYARWNQPDDPLDAAMVGLFNHCIAYLPPTDARQGYYLDATADHNPVGYLRADDQGAQVLHVNELGGEVRDIPYAPPEENMLRRRYVVHIDGRGDARVELSDDSNGHYGVMLRYRYGGEQGDLENNLAEELNDAFGSVTFDTVETADLEDITQPAWVRAAWKAEDVWTSEGELRSLRLSFDDLGLPAVASEPEAERAYDLILDRPFMHDTTILWKLPEGTTIESLPPDVRLSQPGLLDYELSVTEVDGGIEVRRRFTLQARRIDLADYGAFRQRLQAVLQADERTIVVQPAASEGSL